MINANKTQRVTSGFTLIELILFIVILGIAATTILLSFQSVLTNSPDTNRQTTALELAQGRMDFIIGQYYQNGFNNFSDLCSSGSPPAVCLSLSGYTTTSSIVNNGNSETITVTVSGLGSAILTMQIWS